MNTNAILESRLRATRRCLFFQQLIDRLVLCETVALGLGIAFVFVDPFLPATLKVLPQTRILSGLGIVGFVAAVIGCLRHAPSRGTAALALDRRFQLQERVTTAIALTPLEAATSAGEALLADAAAKLEPLSIRKEFAIGFRRRAIFLPIQLAILISALHFYEPMLIRLLVENDRPKTSEDKKADADGKAVQAKNNPFKPILPPTERANKSEELQKLEGELKKLYADAAKPSGSVAREAVAQTRERIASAEERLRKFERQQSEKFQRFQEQMQKLAQFETGEAIKNGPAKDLNDALSKGDLAKAKEEADLLKKKVRDKKIDPADADNLKRQLEDLQKKIERLTNDRAEEKKLQDLIGKAKKEGRDADSLERELKQLQEEAKQLDAMKKLADKLGDIKQALEMNDLDGVEKNLGDLAKQLERMGDALDDLHDVEEHLQNLKEMTKQLADTLGGGRGQSSGKRPENPDAKSDSEEARQRGRFDPKGRKTYAGAVNGPAFTKKTTLELVGEIKQAAQEAPNAIEVQRLPRSAREMVKEYFESLGGEFSERK